MTPVGLTVRFQVQVALKVANMLWAASRCSLVSPQFVSVPAALFCVDVSANSDVTAVTSSATSCLANVASGQRPPIEDLAENHNAEALVLVEPPEHLLQDFEPDVDGLARVE